MNQSYAKVNLTLDEHHLIKKSFESFYDLSPPIVIPSSKAFLSGYLCLRRGRDVVAAAMALFFAAPQARADVGEGGFQETVCRNIIFPYISPWDWVYLPT